MASDVTERLPVDLDQLLKVAFKLDYGAEWYSEAEIVRNAAAEIGALRAILVTTCVSSAGKPDTGLSYSEALIRVLDGDRARMLHWNTDSWMAFKDGKFVIFRDNTRTACQPRDFETESKEWRVIPR